MSEAQSAPEISLLLHCAAGDDSAAGAEALRRLAREVTDWQTLIELASRHALVPVIAQELALAASDVVPPAVLVELRTRSQQGVMRSLQLSGELVDAVHAMTAFGADPIPFKGPTLAVLVYGGLSLRQYEDLDILVRRQEVERARKSLLSLGYSPVSTYNESQRASIRLSGHHEQFANPATRSTIELHWSLNTRSLSRDSFEHNWWENRQSVSIGSVEMHTLGVEQMLLYLCMHGGKHSWGRLSWLCDFQRALRAYPNAYWSRVWALARENGAARMVEIGLLLVESVLNGGALTAAAAQGRSPDAEAKAISELLGRRLRDQATGETSVDFRVQLRARERKRDRLRYTWHVLATPHQADVALLGLPRALHSVYYIVRPVRLLIKHLSRRVRPARAT
ncbi:MAG TPA: nucleotidyltransferase family protein [Gemmatimonadaceae bacterium]|nr:nucleotidyltransferase family protein [Gemmatimonadaceae bacterium]